MKKIILYIIIMILIFFLIPIIFTNQFKNSEPVISKSENIIEEQAEQIQYDYSKYNTIKLLHTKSNQIEELPLEQYLYGVVSAEMPANFELEALMAQAVVARTYTFYKIKHEKKHENADICDDFACCQAWISKEERLEKWDEEARNINWEKIVNAVDSTKGKIITYQGEPINAFFHANSGGITEIPINVWGQGEYPYLQTIETVGEEGYTQYASEIIFTKDELVNKLKQYYPDLKLDILSNETIKITEYTEAKRVKTINIGNINISGVEARQILGLKSANFKIEIQEEEKIKFSVIGYGHGVGMSQTGANTLSKEGKNYQDIIKHYYKDVNIIDI